MSYLLDALRKAERERSLGRVPHLAGVQGGVEDEGQGGLPGWLAPLLAGLIVLNLAAIGYFWWSQDNPPTQTANQPTEATEPLSAPKPVPQQPAPAPQAPETPPPQPAPARQPLPQANASRFSAPPRAEPAERTPPKPAADDTAATDFSEAPDINTLPPGERTALPPLQINGHLYSSVPGRSFVIINGHRYHEGERTRAGPAIVLIDETGVVLDQGGTRFRLRAPH